MIQPKISSDRIGGIRTSNIFEMSDKARFLRLLDLSLRSPKLPSKLIAAFMKRLARVIVTYGEGMAP